MVIYNFETQVPTVEVGVWEPEFVLARLLLSEGATSQRSLSKNIASGSLTNQIQKNIFSSGPRRRALPCNNLRRDPLWIDSRLALPDP